MGLDERRKCLTLMLRKRIDIPTLSLWNITLHFIRVYLSPLKFINFNNIFMKVGFTIETILLDCPLLLETILGELFSASFSCIVYN